MDLNYQQTYSQQIKPKKIIILLTDGEHNGLDPVSNITTYWVSKGISINTIALGNSVNVENLKDIASLTKGGYFYINNENSLSEQDVQKQINLIYEKLSKQLTLSEEAEDEDLPKSKSGMEFSDLYFGIESKEVEDWITTASTNLLTGNYIHTVEDVKIEGTVTASTLNVRSGAGTNNSVIGSLTKGTRIKVLVLENLGGTDWCKINYKNKDGYVSGKYVDGKGGYEVTFATGTKIFFTERANGTLEANNSTDVEFKKLSDGGYQITNKDLSKQFYNASGKLISLEDKNENKVTITYENGKISMVKDEAGNVIQEKDQLGAVTTFQYDHTGNKVKETDANGGVTTYEYNALGRLVLEVDSLGGEKHYQYDKQGNKIKEINQEGQVTEYQYDQLNRLIKTYKNGQLIETKTYDANGNRETMELPNGSHIKYHFDERNLLVKLINIQRDGTTKKTYSYEYDEETYQTKKEEPKGTTTFEYNEIGQITRVA